MNTKIQKWGNSLALRIPKSYAKAADIKEGNDVRLKLEKNRIIVEKENRKKYSLKLMLALVTKENLHGETGTGETVGREIW
jgi:antitoxin MazE